MAKSSRVWMYGVLAISLILGGYFAWDIWGLDSPPAGFASSNGRIEAIEIDISTKTAGRLKELLVREGDFVKAGQVLAQMDTAQLEAGKRQAEAQLRRAEISVDTAHSLVAQREAERKSALAMIEQRKAQLDSAQKTNARSRQLLSNNTVSQQVVDDSEAAEQAARATLASAEASLAASDAAINAAKAQVVDAEASVDADAAQFTPKTVETEEERQKLTFRVRAQIPQELLQKYIQYVKTGLPGMAYVRLDPQAAWPENLERNLLK